eukprot:5872274-Amphidinium_carterae.1
MHDGGLLHSQSHTHDNTGIMGNSYPLRTGIKHALLQAMLLKGGHAPATAMSGGSELGKLTALLPNIHLTLNPCT